MRLQLTPSSEKQSPKVTLTLTTSLWLQEFPKRSEPRGQRKVVKTKLRIRHSREVWEHSNFSPQCCGAVARNAKQTEELNVYVDARGIYTSSIDEVS